MTCSRCGTEIREAGVYCSHCGQRVDPQSQESEYTRMEEDFRAYLGPRAEEYLVKFKRFTMTEGGSFALTWHWPAFIFGFWWFLYRKLYIWALVSLGLWLIPHLALPGWFVWGAVANYLYYRQAKWKIGEYQSRLKGTAPAGTLTEMGGVNRWVWLFVVLFGLIIAAAVMIGGFLLYHLFHEFLNWPEYLEV